MLNYYYTNKMFQIRGIPQRHTNKFFMLHIDFKVFIESFK